MVFGAFKLVLGFTKMSSVEPDFDSEDERIENLPVVGKDDAEPGPSDICYRCL